MSIEQKSTTGNMSNTTISSQITPPAPASFVTPQEPIVLLGEVIDVYKKKGEAYGDAVLHLETAMYKIKNVEKDGKH